METTQSQAEMKEDWAKRLNDKMAGYEEPVPSEPTFIPQRRTPWWLISAVAAAAVVAGVVLWPRSEKASVETVSVQDEALPPAMTEEDPVEEPVSEETLLSVKSVQTRLTKAEVMGNEEPTVVDIPIPQETRMDDSPKDQKKTPDEPSQVVSDEWARLLAERPSRRLPRVHLSVYTQTAPFGRNQTSTTDNPVNPIVNPVDPPVDPVNPPVDPFPNHPNTGGWMGEDPPDDEEGENPDTRAAALEPLENTMALEEQAPWNHRFPLKVGLRVSADIGNGLGVETGLSYLRFLSEHGGKEQQLHYLGIPLRLRHDIWDAQSVSLYGSVGTEALKCIAGNGPDRPWLFTAEAAAGLGWKLSQSIGLYAETGFGRYFHTGESKHYYTEHPYALSMTLGLRFDL